MNNSSTPAVPSDIGPALRQFLLWVRNKLGGSSGRSVTFTDLVAMGVITREQAERQMNR